MNTTQTTMNTETQTATDEANFVANTIDKLNRDVERCDADIKRIEGDIKEVRERIIDAKVSEATAMDKKVKAALKAEIKQLNARIEQLTSRLKPVTEEREEYLLDLTKLKSAVRKESVAQKSGSAADQVFADYNIHFVAFAQKWYSVDGAKDRMQMKLNESHYSVIRDLILMDAQWEVNSEIELKKLAIGLGRAYKHVVRNFSPTTPEGVYNQMNDIRKYWLKPVHGVDPHPAFRILMESVAGGSAVYADQLERYVAYRFCHPEDVMIPNIDSCAIGGTGRETYYNLFNTIFTPECCTIAGAEAFNGTHNGELFGKMIVKVDEKSDRNIPVDVMKELTGGLKYRHRAMGENAVDADRLFTFVIFRNGFTTTIRLAGTGSSGEDRRWEPIIARVNLVKHVAKHLGMINSIDVETTDEQEKTATKLIKQWQAEYWRNEAEVAKWLGHIIDKHNAESMTELLPIHGEYYHAMVARQTRGLDGFMPKLFGLMKESTVLLIKDVWKLYEAAENCKVYKDRFTQDLQYWLQSKRNWQVKTVQGKIHDSIHLHHASRIHGTYLMNDLAVPTHKVFNLSEFIDSSALDDKGMPVGNKINQFSLRDELK